MPRCYSCIGLKLSMKRKFQKDYLTQIFNCQFEMLSQKYLKKILQERVYEEGLFENCMKLLIFCDVFETSYITSEECRIIS